MLNEADGVASSMQPTETRLSMRHAPRVFSSRIELQQSSELVAGQAPLSADGSAVPRPVEDSRTPPVAPGSSSKPSGIAKRRLPGDEDDDDKDRRSGEGLQAGGARGTLFGLRREAPNRPVLLSSSFVEEESSSSDEEIGGGRGQSSQQRSEDVRAGWRDAWRDEEAPSSSSFGQLPDLPDPGMPRLPARRLTLVQDDGVTSPSSSSSPSQPRYQMRPFPEALPVVGPYFWSTSATAFPGSDCVANLPPGRLPVALGAGAATPGSVRAHLALRFEYVADRKAPGAAPALHVFNVSRVARKRRLLSAAHVNGGAVRLLPGDRGLPLRAGDVIEIGLHPTRADVEKAVRFRVVESAAPEPTRDESPAAPPLGPYAEAALRAHGPSKAQIQRLKQQQLPTSEQAAAASERKGPAVEDNSLPSGGVLSAFKALGAEAARAPSNARTWLSWAVLAARTRYHKVRG